jgi:hypothetical protein
VPEFEVTEPLSLAKAGLVAAAERDQKLAQTIAASVLTLAPSMKEGAVSVGLQALLVAGAAFEEEGASRLTL